MLETIEETRRWLDFILIVANTGLLVLIAVLLYRLLRLTAGVHRELRRAVHALGEKFERPRAA